MLPNKKSDNDWQTVNPSSSSAESTMYTNEVSPSHQVAIELQQQLDAGLLSRLKAPGLRLSSCYRINMNVTVRIWITTV